MQDIALAVVDLANELTDPEALVRRPPQFEHTRRVPRTARGLKREHFKSLVVQFAPVTDTRGLRDQKRLFLCK